MASKKTILVTGGNAGIGFALCTVLARDHGCKVYLGSRDHTKGALAVAQILEAVKGADVELAKGSAEALPRRARGQTRRWSSTSRPRSPWCSRRTA